MSWFDAKINSDLLTQIHTSFGADFDIIVAFHAGGEAVQVLWENQGKRQIQNWCVRLTESTDFWTPDVLPKCYIQDHATDTKHKVLFTIGRYICDYDMHIHRIMGANKLYLLYLKKHHFKLNKQSPFGVIL